MKKDNVEKLKLAIEQVSNINISDSQIARIKQEELHAAIYPVMKDYISSLSKHEQSNLSLLLEAVELEDDLSEKHRVFVNQGK